MLFILSTPEYQHCQLPVTKVKVHLSSGIAEIYENHRDLLGRIKNNIIEIESNFENKIEKFLFVLQNAVFIVSNKGLDKSKESQTTVYVYAKQIQEIGPTTSYEKLSKEYNQKKVELDNYLEKNPDALKKSSKISPLKMSLDSKVSFAELLEDELEFLTKSLTILKEMKNF